MMVARVVWQKSRNLLGNKKEVVLWQRLLR
jgi:hypothetical protein